jgi:predicted DNA-binding transcriptional regulator AlpA
MSSTSPPDRFLSLQEVAEITGLDASTIWHGERGTDQLLRIKLGKLTRFSLNNVREWIEKRGKDEPTNKEDSQAQARRGGEEASEGRQDA